MSNAVATMNTVRTLRADGGREIADNPWDVMWHQASILIKSGFLPQAIKTPEQAVAIMLTGDELGIPKMLALRSIHIINGTPTLSADLMASLVQRQIDRHRDGALVVLPPTAESCTVRYRRWGWTEEQAYTYTIKDAQTAGLAGKDTWKKHPGAMLRARAISAVCRMAFPDVIAGLYAPEEIELDPDGPFTARRSALSDGPSALSTAQVTAWTDSGADEMPTVKVVEANGQQVDAETGEILDAEFGQALPDDAPEPKPELAGAQVQRQVKALGKELGWAAKEIEQDAESQIPPASMRTKAGLLATRDRLLGYVAMQFGDEVAQRVAREAAEQGGTA